MTREEIEIIDNIIDDTHMGTTTTDFYKRLLINGIKKECFVKYTQTIICDYKVFNNLRRNVDDIISLYIKDDRDGKLKELRL